jgi:hypothetical protein
MILSIAHKYCRLSLRFESGTEMSLIKTGIALVPIARIASAAFAWLGDRGGIGPSPNQ